MSGKFTGTPIEKVNEFIEKIKNFWIPKANKDREHLLSSFAPTEYYFRQMLYTHKLDDKGLDELYDKFKWSLGQSGEPVGLCGALSIGEALTQASLSAIHSKTGGASVNKIVRQAGMDRFEEVLSGTTAKNTVCTFTLYEDDKDHSMEWANEQETFYMNDIVDMTYLISSAQIEEEVLKLHDSINLKSQEVNDWHLMSVWNLTHISDFNIHVVQVINKLCENYPEILFITGHILNNSQFGAYIYFKPAVPQKRIQLIMEEFVLEKEQNLIHGGYLKNLYVSENKNYPGHYIIEGNEVKDNSLALENLIFDERVNPAGCRTTNIKVVKKIFGTNECRSRLYEEIFYCARNLSDTSNIQPRHYKVFADCILASGDFRFATRNYMANDEDSYPLKNISFETPSLFLEAALQSGKKKHPIADNTSASIFGELPHYGDGFDQITLYSTN